MCQATHFQAAFRCGDSGRCENIGLPHQGIAELEIFVQVIQAIEKISHVSSENGQHSVVSILAYEVHEINAHLIHEFHIRDAENLEKEKSRKVILGFIHSLERFYLNVDFQRCRRNL